MSKSKEGTIEEYRERNIRWTDESLKQLSLYNNLLLTLSVGFLSFAYELNDFKGIYFTCAYLDLFITFWVVSLILIVFSILTGLVLVMNRLQDFRLTRKINQIRQRMLEHSGVKLDEKTPDKFDFWRRVTLIFQNYPIVTIEDCKNYTDAEEKEKDRIKFNFREIRNISHNLGLNTWRNTKLQTLYFALSMLAFLISKLIQ